MNGIKTLKNLERFLLLFWMGGIPWIGGFLLGWWAAYLFLPERWILPGGILGALTGAVVDGICVKNGLTRAIYAPIWVWGGGYLFYSVCTLGFFMGVPVFNLFPGFLFCFLMGCRLAHQGRNAIEAKKAAIRSAWFTMGVLFAACIASAILALTDPFTAANLRGMLGLPFEVTREMMYWFILVGGGALLVIQWWGSRATVWWTWKFLARAG